MKQLILLLFSVELLFIGTSSYAAMVCVLIATPLGCMIVHTALTEGQIMVPPHRHTSYPRMCLCVCCGVLPIPIVILSHNNHGGGGWESGAFIISECCSLITMSPSSLSPWLLQSPSPPSLPLPPSTPKRHSCYHLDR